MKPEKLSPYQVLQAASSFKVGDTVEVVRNWKREEMGYPISQGDVKVGLIDEICFVGHNGLQLKTSGLCVPFFAVKKVKATVRTKKPSEQELSTAYVELQNVSGIKGGDWVKVTRKAKSHEMGWVNEWVSEMDGAIGKVYQVSTMKASAAGVGLNIDKRTIADSYYFPFFVLEKVEKPFEPIQVFGDAGDLVATIYKDSVHIHATDLTHTEVRRLGRAVAEASVDMI
jgi:hypothetical protein